MDMKGQWLSKRTMLEMLERGHLVPTLFQLVLGHFHFPYNRLFLLCCLQFV